MATARRIYVAVAKSVRRELQLLDYNPEQKQAVAALTRAIASDFSDDNARFRHDKFYLACGLTEQGYPYHAFPHTSA